MRTLKILTAEDEKLLNYLLKSKKTESYTLLYHSEWDVHSNRILSVAEEWAQKEGEETCYVISSWELPHAFAAFSITTAPTVVEVNKGTTRVHVEYPKVYSYFSPKPPKTRTKKRRGPRTRGKR